ncbi:MAG TPA: hypothetical protein VG942_09535 [Hyphomonadaceae bacterium]|nr:hypothetical protein [Hyphomonadaceae bacterium]
MKTGTGLHAASVRVALAGLGLALGTATASAQSPVEKITDRISTYASQLPVEPLGDMQVGDLPKDGKSSFTIDVDPRKAHIVVAACSSSCTVDLKAVNAEDGSDIHDGERRPLTTQVYINPLAASKVRIDVVMANCGAKTCTWGAELFVAK